MKCLESLTKMLSCSSSQSWVLLLAIFCCHGLRINAQASTHSHFHAPDGLPYWSDIQHVSTPNAWLEVTLAGLANNNPGIVIDALHDYNNGSVQVTLYDPGQVFQISKTVQKRLWQSEAIASGAVWVAAFSDAMSGLFPYQDDPAWSPFCSQQAAIAITGGTAIQASCDSSSIFNVTASSTIVIMSKDIEGNDHANTTMAVMSGGGGFQGTAGTQMEWMGWSSSAQGMVAVGTTEGNWVLQCSWFQYC
jgi:hypothetical protein